MSWATNQLREHGQQFVNSLMQVVNDFDSQQIKLKNDIFRIEMFLTRMEPYLKTMELISKPEKEEP